MNGVVPERRRFSSNPFELGLFSFNCAGGLYQGKSEFWDASWENNVAAAQLAEEAGLDFLLPLSRWRGPRDYPIERDDEAGAFESLVWAAGLLAVTQRITVFGTLNVAYMNPVFAAKQVATVDHIGRGRFGLNVVSGAGEDDNAMFGVPFGDHDSRYDYTEEWVTIAKRVWSESEPFDYDGRHFKLSQVLGKPKAYGDRVPTIISAGASTRGRAFAIGHAHAVFTAITNFETIGDELRIARQGAPDGAAVPFYASGHLVCRPTRKEADEYYHYLVYEAGDWTGVEEGVARRAANRTVAYLSVEKLKEQIVSGLGTYAVRGSYDDCAQTFKYLHDAGLNGMAIALIDYIGDMTAVRDEVLPRMARLGLRS